MMIYKTIFYFVLLMSSVHVFAQDFQIKTVVEPNSSIRALEVTDGGEVWFAGSNGTYGVSKNNGQTWEIDSISFHGFKLNFRGIASSSQGLHLTAIENPGMVFNTKNGGDSWYLTHFEEGEGVFYDAIHFFDYNEGMILGDPTDDCFSILKTYDSGDSWQKVSCLKLPKIDEKEAAFAASNTNIESQGDSVWIVTGGSQARVLFSADRGENWTVQKTPMISGKTMTGIYSVDFYDHLNGVIIGGDWENKSYNQKNKAVTKDGGKTWRLVGRKQAPGYQSCVQYIPNSGGSKLVSVGSTGVYYSSNYGKTWKMISKKPFYSLKFISPNKAILSGHKIISVLTL